MRISHRHKFVFFSSPKTGSESMRALLDPLSDVRDVQFPRATPAFPFYSHIRPIEVKAAFDRFGWRYDDYYRFVFVRNPWQRLASLYQMVRRLNPRFGRSFGDWLRATRPYGIGGGGPDAARWLKYGTYSLDAYAGDGNGRLLVDEVFRLEDMASVPERLRARGIPLAAHTLVPWVNQAETAPDLGQLYTPELIELVGERYAKEIAEFGYQYTGG
jgi:hypothetical protein